MFRLKNQLSRFGLLAGGLAMLTLVTALGGVWQHQQQLSVRPAAAHSQIASQKAAAQPASQTATGASASGQDSSGGSSVSQRSSGSSASVKSGPTSNTAMTAGQSNAAAPQPASIAVNLSINGQPKGVVTLPAGGNQCDVLNRALAEDVISYLDMRYDSVQQSYGVYVINSIGDPSSVWWTYTVNHYSPPGCSHVTAHNGDSVNWQYVKS